MLRQPRTLPARGVEDSNGVTRPPDVVDSLLGEAVAGTRPELLAIFGAGGGVRALVTASEAQRVLVTDRNMVHAQVAVEALRGLPYAKVLVSEGLSHLDPSLRAHAVAIRAPREKQSGLQLIWDAYRLLQPGGHMYLAGATRDGVKSYLHHAGELFGSMQPLAMRKGCRVGVATRGEDEGVLPEVFTSPFLDHERYQTFEVDVSGRTYTVHSRPGVFAWDRLDGGTQALIETMDVRRGERVLDLGCGYGLVGVAAAGLADDVRLTMVDADIVAVESARRTVAANACASCEVLLGDGAKEIASGAYDLVAVNPPFHLDRKNDYRTAERFIVDSERVLRPGGRLFLVANRFLAYERPIREVFGQVAKAYEDRSYKVLTARKRDD
jgi:16S rRNA (guanine1207-N2)-methyltransferase